MNNFLPTIKDLVLKYKLSLAKDKTKDIHELLCKYIETLIFNIISIASIITMINNSDTIKKQTITLVKSYINDKCNHKFTGGTTGLPSEYYGVDSGLYSSNNAGSDILNIDFASGMLRPQIGGGGHKNMKQALAELARAQRAGKKIENRTRLEIARFENPRIQPKNNKTRRRLRRAI